MAIGRGRLAPVSVPGLLLGRAICYYSQSLGLGGTQSKIKALNMKEYLDIYVCATPAANSKPTFFFFFFFFSFFFFFFSPMQLHEMTTRIGNPSLIVAFSCSFVWPHLSLEVLN
jgi:hypothetical protein